jgi:outer membrane protein OmpA-like peptidoglycan-associated protein
MFFTRLTSMDRLFGRSNRIDGLSAGADSAANRALDREPNRGRLFMRASMIATLGLAVGLIAHPAYADPAYKASAVADFFAKATLGKSKTICFGTAADCPQPPPDASAKFDLLVTFEFDSDKLTAAARENLDQFAQALHDPRLKGQKFEIDGHTDATGTEAYNQGLSQRRAQAVIAYLATQGVDGTELLGKGFGKTKPRVSDPFSPENRRVETHLLEQP